MREGYLEETVKKDLERRGPLAAVLEEAESFRRRIRYLVEKGEEVTSEPETIGILEQMEAILELAEAKFDELWRQTRETRGRAAA